MTTRPARSTVKSNWRVPVEITFDLNGQNGELVPVELRNLISDMPVLQESSIYVKKRIASWEGYLEIQEKSVDIPDRTSRYSKVVYNDNFKAVLKESLFERLFKNLPKANKTMLAIQYRMHEDIMETIAQFYKQEKEGLHCG